MTPGSPRPAEFQLFLSLSFSASCAHLPLAPVTGIAADPGARDASPVSSQALTALLLPQPLHQGYPVRIHKLSLKVQTVTYMEDPRLDSNTNHCPQLVRVNRPGALVTPASSPVPGAQRPQRTADDNSLPPTPPYPTPIPTPTPSPSPQPAADSSLPSRTCYVCRQTLSGLSGLAHPCYNMPLFAPSELGSKRKPCGRQQTWRPLNT